MTSGVLHLIPVPLGDIPPDGALPLATLTALRALNYFIVEDERSARRFLAAAAHPCAIRSLRIERFDKDSDASRARQVLQPLNQGISAGLLSEAGCPAVADPGALVVAAAHSAGLQVVPHVGPASMILALMASGFNGQQFMFHGYLPPGRDQCRAAIAGLEQESRSRNTTQIFIETRHRSDALLALILETCEPVTRLCVACDLTLPTQSVRSRHVRDWRRSPGAPLGRRPSVFVLYAR